jgi:hypothetical protein
MVRSSPLSNDWFAVLVRQLLQRCSVACSLNRPWQGLSVSYRKWNGRSVPPCAVLFWFHYCFHYCWFTAEDEAILNANTGATLLGKTISTKNSNRVCSYFKLVCRYTTSTFGDEPRRLLLKVIRRFGKHRRVTRSAFFFFKLYSFWLLLYQLYAKSTITFLCCIKSYNYQVPPCPISAIFFIIRLQ